MLRYRSLISLILISFVLFVERSDVQAAFDVSMWNLRTGVLQLSGVPPFDLEDILDVTNPLIQTTYTQLEHGTTISFSRSHFDYAWLTEAATGHFNTSLAHAIRAPDVNTHSRGQIFILADEPLRLSIEGAVSYAHTPGDDSSVLFGFSVRDTTTNDFNFQQTRLGGFANLQSAAGLLTISGEQTLNPGIIYRLQYTLDCHNIPDPLPSGILDATGYINLDINPVPEPSSLALLALGVPLLVRRRRMPFA